MESRQKILRGLNLVLKFQARKSFFEIERLGAFMLQLVLSRNLYFCFLCPQCHLNLPCNIPLASPPRSWLTLILDLMKYNFIQYSWIIPRIPFTPIVSHCIRKKRPVLTEVSSCNCSSN
jgi:hypothetical protein